MKLSMKWTVQSPYLKVLSAESVEDSRSVGTVVTAEKVIKIVKDMATGNQRKRARCF